MLTGNLGQQMNALPVQIFSDITVAAATVIDRAWGAALALVVTRPDPQHDCASLLAKESRGMIPPDTTSKENESTCPGAEAPPEQAEAAPDRTRAPASREGAGHADSVKDLNAYYGDCSTAIKGINIDFPPNQVTALIGPSGSGKSTVVRCINRMHEEIPGARAEGR